MPVIRQAHFHSRLIFLGCTVAVGTQGLAAQVGARFGNGSPDDVSAVTHMWMDK